MFGSKLIKERKKKFGSKGQSTKLELKKIKNPRNQKKTFHDFFIW